MRDQTTILRSVAAGMLIGLGCAVYLSCDNKALGAALFSVGLLLICLLELFLFTGKIGYIRRSPKYPNCFAVWLGNLVGIAAVAGLARLARPQMHEAAAALAAAKFALPVWQVAILAVLCGMVMYLAVETFRRRGNTVGGVLAVVLCVITFILCGFEHSVADMGYCVFAVRTLRDLVLAARLVAVASVGNGVGAVVMDLLLQQRPAAPRRDQRPPETDAPAPGSGAGETIAPARGVPPFV